MKTLDIKENPHFIGQSRELEIIKKMNEQEDAQILICYGRRRVGKSQNTQLMALGQFI